MSSYEVVFPENKKIDVKFNGFEIKTDQAKENGGDETAPEPFDLFLASIASCAGIYAKVFCDTRKIDTKDMKIVQTVYREEGQAIIKEISMTLFVGKVFDPKYEKPVLKAMQGCAVKKQLHPDIKVTAQIQRRE